MSKTPFLAALVISLAASISLPCHAQAYDNRPAAPALKMLTGEWTWANFSKFAGNAKPEKDPDSKNRYMLTVGLADGKRAAHSVTFYGSKEKPDAAVFESRFWGMVDETDAFFRFDKFNNLTKINSNCNLKDIAYSKDYKDRDGYEYSTGGELDFQQTYRYPIGTNKTLYMTVTKASSIVITSSYQSQHYTLAILTPHKDKLGVFTNAYGWSTNKKGKTIQCKLS